MIKNKHACDLDSCSFCKTCLPEWLPAIEQNRKTVKFKKGSTIFSEGEAVNGIYFINTGTVKVHKQWGEKELIIRFAKDGEIVGHRGLGNELTYPVSATTLENSTLCYIDFEFYQTSLKVNPEYLMSLMLFFASELKTSEKKMRNLAHMPVKGRIAQALLELENKFGKDEHQSINLLLSKQDLASYVGATYETVFRMLNELENEGVITQIGKKLNLLKKTALNNLINTI